MAITKETRLQALEEDVATLKEKIEAASIEERPALRKEFGMVQVLLGQARRGGRSAAARVGQRYDQHAEAESERPQGRPNGRYGFHASGTIE